MQKESFEAELAEQRLGLAKLEQLRNQWLAEEQVPFVGWDFSYLNGRMSEEALPWDYMALAATQMAQATSLLDMATGAGERLLSLRPHWPLKVAVTEGYLPNFALAQERLAPFGVMVVACDSSNFSLLPFADDEFDLVLNRHGAFNSQELARIFAPGGIFLTQQVHGLFAYDLIEHFDASPRWPAATYEDAITRLAAAGLQITQGAEWRGKLLFSDVGAVVYYLKAVPWLVPDFGVEHYFDSLLALQTRLEEEGELSFAAMHYWVQAHQPN